MDKPIGALRREYTLSGLSEADAEPNALRLFDRWFDEAVRDGLIEPNAMTLATATPDGRPSARIILLKGFDENGFVFYTDFTSRKGRELDVNPHAALCFWWPQLERQVRIEGRVHRIAPEESDAYFASRPRDSQLGAAVSQQSAVIEGRESLERRLAELQTLYRDRPIPRPEHWGGYCLKPDAIEFWQGRPHRLHDRLRYERKPDGGWMVTRLSP